LPAKKKQIAKTKGKKPVAVPASKKKQAVVPERARQKDSKRAAPGPEPDEQFRSFEQGIQLFNKSQFKLAKECFRKALVGSSLSISHASQLRLQLCDQQLARGGNPSSAGT